MKITKQMKNRVLPFMLAASITVVSVFSSKFLSAPTDVQEDGVQTEQEEETVELLAENGDVSASAEGSSIEDGTSLHVEELPYEKMQEYSELINGKYGGGYEISSVYKVYMEDQDGNAVQPDGSLEMLLGSMKIGEAVKGDGNIVLFQNLNEEPEEQAAVQDDVQDATEEQSISYESMEDGTVIISQDEQPSVLSDEPDSDIHIIGEENDEQIQNLASAAEDESGVHVIGGDMQTATPSNAAEPEETDQEAPTGGQPMDAAGIVSLPASVEVDKIAFNTGKLTEFVVATRAAGETRGIQLGKNQSMYINKYLEQTGNDTWNGQDTYDVYLEHEFYDSSDPSKTVLEPAPMPSHIVLILDQSTTMRNEPTEMLNKAVKNFFQKMMKINQKRLEDAKAGKYDGINGTSMTDAEIRNAMSGHLMYVSGVTGYHNSVVPKNYNGSQVWNKAPLTQADVDSLAAAAFVVNDNDYAPTGVEDLTGDIQSGTNTDAALEWAYNFIQANPHSMTATDKSGNVRTIRTDNVMLLTDGLGNSSPGEASRDWLYFRPASMERAIYQAQRIKNLGAMVYSVYERDMDMKYIQPALEANGGKGDLNKIVLPGRMTIIAMYMGLISSDSPLGGSVGYNTTTGQLHVDNPAYANNRDAWYTINNHPENQFGTYSFFGTDVGDIVNIMDNMASQVNEDAKKNKITGYASNASFVKDVISDPFEIMGGSTNIQVYAVPRIPAELDENNIPVGIVADRNDPNYGIVNNFRWGEKMIENGDGTYSSEWINVTNEVKIQVEENSVKVSGWDYEQNALRNWDKDIANKSMFDDALVYRPGDYGYKIVVIIPINAKITFGGNNIETNNSDISAFYPSVPGGISDSSDPSYRPPWEENAEYNPGRVEYIQKYPNPKVDLNINYKIVFDNIKVYAPQTAELYNIVTDSYNRIFYMDESYDDIKAEKDYAYSEYVSALKKAQDAGDNEPLWSDVLVKNGEYMKASQKLASLESYVPDGINNAFVNIDYTLKDPEGNVLGTMHIPHGKPYIEDGNGKGNISWQFTEGADAIIKKSGEYTISCTVTPVDTTRAPGGHVSTEADDQGTRDLIPYDSKEYSPTGSSASGSQSSKVITANPTAHLFQLKAKASDTRLLHHQALDFNVGTEPLMTTENVHFPADRLTWVCTDGVTESNPEDEPGITGMLKVGSGVNASSQIPDAAMTEGLVEDMDGTLVTGAEDGGYVPVSVILARNVGNLNKSADVLEQTKQTQVIMTDSDNIWGDGVSSVIWEHECNILGTDECGAEEFADAQKYSTPEDSTGKGTVRYLIHVLDNPMPNIEKETSTPMIAKGADIKWGVDITNDDEKTNKNHRSSVFSFVDILPHVGDERIDPDTGREGSQFGGGLSYKTIKIDFSNAARAVAAANGEYKLLYTTDKACRTANEQQLLGGSKEDSIAWESVLGEADGSVVSYPVPLEAEAVRVDTELDWMESIRIDMTANMRDASDQQAGDYYHNEALVLSGQGMKVSNTVATEVSTTSLSGTIWEDADADGLMSAEEKRFEKITVKLYQRYDPKNPGKPAVTINGVQLVPVYDQAGEQYPAKSTDENGYFEFRDIPEGTYYVVAEGIPDGYGVTKKHAGTDETTSLLDSEAEEEFTATAEDLTSTAWIKEIVVGAGEAQGQNIGLVPIRGSIKIHKTLDEIYYAVTKTDEEKAKSSVMFTFVLTNKDTGRKYQKSVQINQNNLENGAYAVFEGLPYGTYVLTEEATEMYTLESITCDSTQASWDDSSKSLTFTVSSAQYDFEAEANNKLTEDPPGIERPGLSNAVKAHIPVKMEIKYAGADPVSSKTLTRYDFKAEDFDPAKGGDIIITFDDGSQISIAEGTLRFDQVSLLPTYVTNRMNTAKGDKYTVKGYYSENGHTVSDSFKVAIDLKPVHKFNIKFDANGSSFDTSSTTNSVYFGYDNETKENYVIRGQYKDAGNGGLKPLTGFTFAGWNTKDDGSGVQYSTRDALNAIGANDSIKTITLYANWKTNVRFYAGAVNQGAKMSNGITNAEKALNNKNDGYIAMNLGQVVSTNLIPNKTGHIQVGWNTNPNGTGTWIENYGKIKGPVTFYAVYYRRDYYYTGGFQTFTAPKTGWYKIQLWGARGGDDGHEGANGGYTEGDVYLTAGKSIYVVIGASGRSHTGGAEGGYNGGGNTGPVGTSGSGGGASDIRSVYGSWNNYASLRSRILVAGGGGGGGYRSAGGVGGGLYGRSGGGGAGGTPTSAGYLGGFGYGGTPSFDGGGGGGGWYGGGVGSGGWPDCDIGGGGGSGYYGGAPGFQVRNGKSIDGASSMPAVYERRDAYGNKYLQTSGYMTGNAGACYAIITRL